MAYQTKVLDPDRGSALTLISTYLSYHMSSFGAGTAVVQRRTAAKTVLRL